MELSAAAGDRAAALPDVDLMLPCGRLLHVVASAWERCGDCANERLSGEDFRSQAIGPNASKVERRTLTDGDAGVRPRRR